MNKFCVASSTALIFFSFACKSAGSRSDASIKSEITADPSRYRALAEWEEMNAIVLSVPLVDEMKGTSFRDEYINMVKLFLENSKAQILMYSTKDSGDGKLFYSYLPELEPYRKRIKFMPVDKSIVTATPENDDDFGTWMRDASPISGVDIKSGELVYFDMRYGSPGEVPWADSVPLHFEKSEKIKLVPVDLQEEGGNFMTTQSGICATSYGIGNFDESEAQDKAFIGTMGCKKVIHLKEIEGSTPHIDMYAKFVDDKTVMVTKFKDDSIYFDGTLSICKSWDDCTTQTVDLKPAYYPRESFTAWLEKYVTDHYTAVQVKGYRDLPKREVAFIKPFFPKEKAFGADSSLKAITDKWVQQFKEEGFTVKEIPTTPPTVAVSLVTNTNEMVAVSIQLDFVTYANSLTFNDKVFVPTYKYEPRFDSWNENALKVYRDLGLNVVDVPTNEITKGRMGSVHCMTMNLRL